MMLTWIDGHLVLVLILCPVAAVLIIGWFNARTARRMQARRNIFAARGSDS